MIVKSTGEEIDFNPQTLEELQQVWLICSEYEKAYKSVKDKLKPMVESFVNANGVSDPVNGYMFRVSNVQRMNYDKAVLRRVIEDEDKFDELLAVDKKAVDEYLKEHLADLGEASTELRTAMVPVGKPYQVIKAEKIER